MGGEHVSLGTLDGEEVWGKGGGRQALWTHAACSWLCTNPQHVGLSLHGMCVAEQGVLRDVHARVL